MLWQCQFKVIRLSFYTYNVSCEKNLVCSAQEHMSLVDDKVNEMHDIPTTFA
jgi:hypothetical protein